MLPAMGPGSGALKPGFDEVETCKITQAQGLRKWLEQAFGSQSANGRVVYTSISEMKRRS